mgnify:FL=1
MANRGASPSQIAVRTFTVLAIVFAAAFGGLWLWRSLDEDWCNRGRAPHPVHGKIICSTISY